MKSTQAAIMEESTLIYYILSALIFVLSLSELNLISGESKDTLCFKLYKADDRCRRPMTMKSSDASSCCRREHAQGYSEIVDKDKRLGFKCKSCEGLNQNEDSLDGGWSPWSPWSECSATCGKASEMRRTRTCDNPPPKRNGKVCGGDWTQEKSCNKPDCPVDGNWGQWSNFGSCSVTCGNGVRRRKRRCDNPPAANGGGECIGHQSENVKCQLPDCPIDGNWSPWNPWSSCSATCDTGIQQRWRACDNPFPKYGGKTCRGPKSGVRNCILKLRCPINGKWSEWTPWSLCYSDNCNSGLGVTVSQRTCNSPRTQFNGRMCQGVFVRDGVCTDPINCALTGEWSGWSKWECIAPGIIQRTRGCNFSPDPTGNRKKTPCVGQDSETKISTDSKIIADQVSRICGSGEENPNGDTDEFGSGSGSGSGDGLDDQED